MAEVHQGRFPMEAILSSTQSQLSVEPQEETMVGVTAPMVVQAQEALLRIVGPRLGGLERRVIRVGGRAMDIMVETHPIQLALTQQVVVVEQELLVKRFPRRLSRLAQVVLVLPMPP